MRLIDADELRDRVGYIEDEYGHINEEINNMPTIEAEPVRHGRWIYREYKMSKGESIGYFVCSECGHATWVKEDNYCSYCGTKMDLKEVEE